jgi:hypothetical protein
VVEDPLDGEVIVDVGHDLELAAAELGPEDYRRLAAAILAALEEAEASDATREAAVGVP